MSYWKDRQSETLEEILKNADISADEIANIYAKSSFYINNKIQGIFDRYRSKYGLGIQEAKILLNQLDDPTSYDEMIKHLRNLNGDERQDLLKKLESPAYKYRINRFQEVQNSLDAVMSNIYDQEKKISTLSYIDAANDSYYKTIFNIQKNIGVEFSFSNLNPKHIDTILKANWSGKNYSERIWNNTQELSKQVKEELLMGILVGKTEREMSQTITEKFQVANYNARRLIQTESAYISTMMDIEAYKEAGIDTMRFVAMHDLKTSKICQQHDSKYVKIKDAVVGSNVPPLHPHCRSFMEPVIDEELDKNMKRRVKDENGQYKIVDANETYEQWYERTQEKKLDKSGWNEKDRMLNIDEEWLPFKSSKTELVNNSKEIIDSYFKNLNIEQGSKEFENILREEFKIIPTKDLDILKTFNIGIVESQIESSYSLTEKQISINSTNYTPGVLAHELAHCAIDKFDLYNIPKLKSIMENVLNSREGLLSHKIGGKEYIYINSSRFIRKYQGRTYITKEEFIKDKSLLNFDKMEEYVSVGYETFVSNPDLLYNKDIELYNFFKEGGLNRDK